MKVAGQAVLDESGCSDVECLKGLPASQISTMGSTARSLVVDGEYLTSDELEINGNPLGINLMMGIASEDGSPFLRYAPGNTTDAKTLLASQGLPYPSKVVFPEYKFDNRTLAEDWVGARLATDAIFRCVDQATAHGLLQTGRLPSIYYYEFDRTYQTPGWPKSSLCEPEGRPDGNPESGPYMRCHSGELLYVFGNIAREGLPLRDDLDLEFERLVLDMFASFARTGNPNPDEGYLAARKFDGTSNLLGRAGTWEPAVKGDEKLRVLDWPQSASSMMESFRDVEQCEMLDIGLDYYL
jgi:carboxylesterase type B